MYNSYLIKIKRDVVFCKILPTLQDLNDTIRVKGAYFPLFLSLKKLVFFTCKIFSILNRYLNKHMHNNNQ